MMFNTDFEIFFDVELDQTGKATCKLEPNCVLDVSCGKNNLCGKADTYEQGHGYIKVTWVLQNKIIYIFKYYWNQYYSFGIN